MRACPLEEKPPSSSRSLSALPWMPPSRFPPSHHNPAMSSSGASMPTITSTPQGRLPAMGRKGTSDQLSIGGISVFKLIQMLFADGVAHPVNDLFLCEPGLLA